MAGVERDRLREEGGPATCPGTSGQTTGHRLLGRKRKWGGEGLEAWALGWAGKDGAESRDPSTVPRLRSLPGKHHPLLKVPGGRCV